jgi:hypothetical protein
MNSALIFILTFLSFGFIISWIRELEDRVAVLEKRLDYYTETNKELLDMMKEIEEKKK